jgi:pimeloyl-ACP methyl ester carboxylesterase
MEQRFSDPSAKGGQTSGRPGSDKNMLRRLSVRRYSSLFLCVAAGLVTTSTVQSQTKPAPGPGGGLDIIFVINGSAAGTSVTENLTSVIAKHRLAINTDTIAWCRWGSQIQDHTDYWAQIYAANCLAAKIADYHARWPKSKIYLIGHSAGTHITLLAAGKMPPNTLERVVLLAPSVSTCFDLRPALRASRKGIDCYYSFDDNIVAVGTWKFGTADRLFVKSAGEIGFTRLAPNLPDAGLYQKLHQFRWTPEMAWTGNRGGHYGPTSEGFLDFYVLPVMLK